MAFYISDCRSPESVVYNKKLLRGIISGGFLLEQNIAWYMDKRIERTIEGFRKRNMEGYIVNDETELIELLNELIPQNSVVGVGDSMTLFETI